MSTKASEWKNSVQQIHILHATTLAFKNLKQKCNNIKAKFIPAVSLLSALISKLYRHVIKKTNNIYIVSL